MVEEGEDEVYTSWRQANGSLPYLVTSHPHLPSFVAVTLEKREKKWDIDAIWWQAPSSSNISGCDK